MSDTCRSCGAQIFWVVMVGTGKRNPLDLEPAPKGNVRTNGATASVVSKLEPAKPGETLHQSHFVSCPQRRAWRREGRS